MTTHHHDRDKVILIDTQLNLLRSFAHTYTDTYILVIECIQMCASTMQAMTIQWEL